MLFELVEYRQGFENYFKKPVDIKTLAKFANGASQKIERLKKWFRKQLRIS
ncbi:hypothetical protein HRM2_p00220 (plasmid) [Desulforapulum autotrophicum HRM2]|uniref:Uncharacterized protein n=1 Tax=Desulforapulum autotrophicum (strain ATCC 43914 / DSM 3382 / VKM B-1955 / HRM2) TaxID=177437 RepID=C0QMM2_DESAH|nr:hypothetical protein HRM2_p00220 [Desulforapulum autotrophicum HRM2]